MPYVCCLSGFCMYEIHRRMKEQVLYLTLPSLLFTMTILIQ